MKSGIGFPTGVNRNHCAAHFSPNAGDKTGESISTLLSSFRHTVAGVLKVLRHAQTVLLYEDTLKVDFGVHVNGRIVDSAFTLNFEPTYDNLLLACREATETGVRVSLCLCDVLRFSFGFVSSTRCVARLIGSGNRCQDGGYRCCDPRDDGIVRSRGRRKDSSWSVSLPNLSVRFLRARRRP